MTPEEMTPEESRDITNVMLIDQVGWLPVLLGIALLIATALR